MVLEYFESEILSVIAASQRSSCLTTLIRKSKTNVQITESDFCAGDLHVGCHSTSICKKATLQWEYIWEKICSRYGCRQ
ncbi:hypothetical protein NPIL_388581 [Nephila pilipes]|uniref:Uncharacterized protein n=1 Tax=Nephila pilipes TaxID=299642 RepID=A0A8X6QEH6_NEPPI|nr:hypothetical protein NPIL_388581 [Nephila pilipes]